MSSASVATSGASASAPGGTVPAWQQVSVFSVWAVFNLLLGSLSPGTGLYVSQLGLMLLCALVVGRACLRRDTLSLLSPAVVAGGTLAWCLASLPFGNPRFAPEFLKALLLIAPAMLLARVLTWRDVDALSRQVPVVVLVVLVLVLGSGMGFYYGEEGRFGVPWWGSPNNTGFVIAMALALLAYRTHARRFGRPAVIVWPAVVIGGVLIAFVLATQSLGGMLSTLIITLRFLGVRLRTLFSGFALLVATVVLLTLLVPAFVLPELIGSGRLIIWQVLLDDLAAAGPKVWLVGRGPGAIDLQLWFTASVQSAHSMYIEVLYAYGLGGLVAMVAACVWAGRRIAEADLPVSKRLFIESLYAALVVGFFVDTYLMTAQLTWLGALLLALLGAGAAGTRRRR